MLNKFIRWFESEYPEFVNSFGGVRGFYAPEPDEFMIEEINDAYAEFKRGDDPMPMYFKGRM